MSDSGQKSKKRFLKMTSAIIFTPEGRKLRTSLHQKMRRPNTDTKTILAKNRQLTPFFGDWPKIGGNSTQLRLINSQNRHPSRKFDLPKNRHQSPTQRWSSANFRRKNDEILAVTDTKPIDPKSHLFDPLSKLIDQLRPSLVPGNQDTGPI